VRKQTDDGCTTGLDKRALLLFDWSKTKLFLSSRVVYLDGIFCSSVASASKAAGL